MSKLENQILERIKPSGKRNPVLRRVRAVLGKNVRINQDGTYHLWRLGQYFPANLDHIVRAANERLKELGAEQINDNSGWLV